MTANYFWKSVGAAFCRHIRVSRAKTKQKSSLKLQYWFIKVKAGMPLLLHKIMPRMMEFLGSFFEVSYCAKNPKGHLRLMNQRNVKISKDISCLRYVAVVKLLNRYGFRNSQSLSNQKVSKQLFFIFYDFCAKEQQHTYKYILFLLPLWQFLFIHIDKKLYAIILWPKERKKALAWQKILVSPYKRQQLYLSQINVFNIS